MTDQISAPDRTAELLTIGEAAQLLRAPVATLRYWRHPGTGPHSFRLGRRIVYRRDDLGSWIDGQAASGSGTSSGPLDARRP
ncbi:helix-turn-helix domain-containing protein [Geodermatophilus sp. URMC 62]|uniref:helix-turn-helix domain-containing protein n=1 Tax=Geodermatophilus sp. URMC 62 TaxID=3423414 RepID=UPI00406C9D01